MKCSNLLHCSIAAALFASAGAFMLGGGGGGSQQCRRQTTTKTRRNVIVDPTVVDPAVVAGMEDLVGLDAISTVGIAVTSAAAGAMSQLPRMQELERELEVTRSALNDSEQEMVSKIAELEEKLFLMDREFEGQTEKFKKQYDLRAREELNRATEKVKRDYQFKLDIRLEEQKSKMLQDRLDLINSITGEKEEELANLQFKQHVIAEANRELEKALAESQAELERLREATRKKGWWPF